MSFDLARAVRAIKPQKRTEVVARRHNDSLPWAEDVGPSGPPLLLDTTVYIDILQDRAPASVEVLVERRTCHHSAVGLAELTHGFGRLDPAHRSTPTALQAIEGVIERIPNRRLHAPDADVWGRAGMLVGTMLRIGDIPTGAGQERALLNDALLALQAQSMGLTLLTRNIRDFDRITQILAGVSILFYERRAP